MSSVKWVVNIEPAHPNDPYWLAYGDEDAAKIEQAFQKKSKTMMLNKTYEIDFPTMRQIRRDDVDRWRTIKRVGKAEDSDEKPPQPQGSAGKPEEEVSGGMSLSMSPESRYLHIDSLLSMHSLAIQKIQQQVEKQTKELERVQRMWDVNDHGPSIALLVKSVQEYPSTKGIETLKTYLNRLSPSIVTEPTTTTHTNAPTVHPTYNQSTIKTNAGEGSRDGSVSESLMRQVQADDKMEDKINFNRITVINPIPSTCSSPISSQPVTNLALICRYLAPKELLAIDKTSRLLSKAASHPLTFHHETEVGVEHDLYHCRSYARGPVGIFSGNCMKLQKALTSRLFRHFRILELRHVNRIQGNYQSMIVWSDWLKCLATSLTTPIRALTLQVVPYPHQSSILSLDEMELDFFQPALIEWNQSLAMKYLTMLHLDLDESMIMILKYIPPSIKILHLTLSDADCNVQSILDGILTLSSKDRADSIHLEHLILDGSTAVNQSHRITNCYDLLSLAAFSHQANVEVIHWQFSFNLHLLVTGGIIELLPKLVEHKILHLHTISIEFEPNRSPNDTDYDMFHVLDIFSDLRCIIFRNAPPLLAFTSTRSSPIQIIQETVEEIRVAFNVGEQMVQFLVAVGFKRLRTLVFDGDLFSPKLVNLFLSEQGHVPCYPNLTSLSIRHFGALVGAFQKEDDQQSPLSPYFSSATISQLEAICSTPLDTAAISKALPSLVELRLQHVLSTSSMVSTMNDLLSHLPAFKRIRWGSRGWMNQLEAIKQLQVEEARQQEDLRLFKETQEAHRLKERQRFQAQQAAAQRKQDEQLKQLGSLTKLPLDHSSQIKQHLRLTSMPSSWSETGTIGIATGLPTNTVDSTPQPQPILFTKKVIKGKKVRHSTDQLTPSASTTTRTTSPATSINTFTPTAFNFVTPIGNQAPTTSLTNLTETSFATSTPFVFSPFPSTTTTAVSNPFTLAPTTQP